MIRFAPLIRVSTEKQKLKGESLRTQKTQNIKAVEQLGGTIPDSCWKYSGQEHATPDQERKLLDQLLADSGNGIFDAVIVTHHDRWSRNNLKSEQGLEILLKNRIRFFVGTTEKDLSSPFDRFEISMYTSMAQLQAATQAKKSLENRIERARRGVPSVGRLPYGRTYTEGKGWGIQAEKQQIMKDAAKRYIAGEQIKDIAATMNLNQYLLFRNLKFNCGPTWEVQFVNKNKTINETVIFDIPELLDPNTIKKVHERIDLNRRSVKDGGKYNFLLSGLIYCARCGYKMTTNRNPQKREYYRHRKCAHNLECHSTFGKMIPAREIENTVLLKLVQTFGDREKIEAAIQRATPDLAKFEKLEKEHADLTIEQIKVSKQKENVIEKVAAGILTNEEVLKTINKLRDKEQSIVSRLTALENELLSIPDPEQVKKASSWASKVISASTRSNPSLIFKRDFAWKRRLLEQAFSGTNQAGERLGIYVDHNDGVFSYELRTQFETNFKVRPPSDDELIEIFNLADETVDTDKELNAVRDKYFGKCQCQYHQGNIPG